jgi:hypothetical protein
MLHCAKVLYAQLSRLGTPPIRAQFLEERLVLGASRLHIGRHCGGYRGKSYEGKTNMICLWGDSPARGRFVTVSTVPER